MRGSKFGRTRKLRKWEEILLKEARKERRREWEEILLGKSSAEVEDRSWLEILIEEDYDTIERDSRRETTRD